MGKNRTRFGCRPSGPFVTDSAPEFDAYSAEYGAGMENPVKALMGNSAEAFIEVKLRWLLRRFPDIQHAGSSFHVLDYGCGIATLLRLMSERTGATLMGCDISSGMLQEAMHAWPSETRRPEFHLQNGARTELPNDCVDLVILSAVLHHVVPDARPDVFGEIRRILRPGGRLVVFEHNPLNPVTRYVVSRTPIDQHAILLRASEVHAELRKMQFADVRTSYLMFVPPRFGRLANVEKAIGWLPLGAQYATVGRRST
jgi:ubiquinone/menaquinone biosynthesis C-methylase UbiE